MRQVEQHADAVHFGDDLAAEQRQAGIALLHAAIGGMFGLVIGEVHRAHAQLEEGLYHVQFAPQGRTALEHQHNGEFICALGGKNLVGGPGQHGIVAGTQRAGDIADGAHRRGRAIVMQGDRRQRAGRAAVAPQVDILAIAQDRRTGVDHQRGIVQRAGPRIQRRFWRHGVKSSRWVGR